MPRFLCWGKSKDGEKKDGCCVPGRKGPKQKSSKDITEDREPSAVCKKKPSAVQHPDAIVNQVANLVNRRQNCPACQGTKFWHRTPEPHARKDGKKIDENTPCSHCKQCKSCDGEGTIGYDRVYCTMCSGKGHMHRSNKPHNPIWKDWCVDCEKCLRCGGAGHTPPPTAPTCIKCKGKGYVHHSQKKHEAPDGEWCRHCITCTCCDGLGIMPDDTQACFQCHGAGVVHRTRQPHKESKDRLCAGCVECEGCYGRGCISTLDVACKTCYGKGVYHKVQTKPHEHEIVDGFCTFCTWCEDCEATGIDGVVEKEDGAKTTGPGVTSFFSNIFSKNTAECPGCRGKGFMHRDPDREHPHEARRCDYCIDCTTCKGFGQVQVEKISCFQCKGIGVVHRSDQEHIPIQGNWCEYCQECEPCKGSGFAPEGYLGCVECQGSGLIDGSTCPGCKGFGHVKEEVTPVADESVLGYLSSYIGGAAADEPSADEERKRRIAERRKKREEKAAIESLGTTRPDMSLPMEGRSPSEIMNDDDSHVTTPSSISTIRSRRPSFELQSQKENSSRHSVTSIKDAISSKKSESVSSLKDKTPSNKSISIDSVKDKTPSNKSISLDSEKDKTPSNRSILIDSEKDKTPSNRSISNTLSNRSISLDSVKDDIPSRKSSPRNSIESQEDVESKSDARSERNSVESVVQVASGHLSVQSGKFEAPDSGALSTVTADEPEEVSSSPFLPSQESSGSVIIEEVVDNNTDEELEEPKEVPSDVESEESEESEQEEEEKLEEEEEENEEENKVEENKEEEKKLFSALWKKDSLKEPRPEEAGWYGMFSNAAAAASEAAQHAWWGAEKETTANTWW